jgi:hypothetical protein
VADRAQGAVGRGHKVAVGPPPTRRLGIDETQFRSVRWTLDGIAWSRCRSAATSFVDCFGLTGRDCCWGWLLAARSMWRDWLTEQSQQFRDGIKIVTIDPSAPYDSGIRPARQMPRSRSISGIWSP